jgi:hypothetical protein
MKTTLITTIAALLATTCLSLTASAEDTPRRNKEFKGVDLYARFDNNKIQWLFGLLPGTNVALHAQRIARCKLPGTGVTFRSDCAPIGESERNVERVG